MVYQVTDMSDFQGQLAAAGNKLVVIDFFATWCGPCVRIAPLLDELSKQYPDVVFLKVDVDKCSDISQQYGIRSMPTFVFVKSGTKVEEFSGADPNKLRAVINARK